jgi:hypothetical protein
MSVKPFPFVCGYIGWQVMRFKKIRGSFIDLGPGSIIESPVFSGQGFRSEDIV